MVLKYTFDYLAGIEIQPVLCVSRSTIWDRAARPILYLDEVHVIVILTVESFREFKALVQISLDGCNLQEVPNPLFALTSLKILNLENNEIKSFENPNNYVLDSLEELSLTRNQLSGMVRIGILRKLRPTVVEKYLTFIFYLRALFSLTNFSFDDRCVPGSNWQNI